MQRLHKVIIATYHTETETTK